MKRAEESGYWPSGLTRNAGKLNSMLVELGLIERSEDSLSPTSQGLELGISCRENEKHNRSWCTYTDAVFREVVRRLGGS